MTTTATLVTKFVADTNEFNNKIKSSEASVGSLASKITVGMAAGAAAFTAIAGVIGGFIHQLNESADRVSKLADNAAKIGVSVAHFQELAVAAREAGVSADSLQTILGLMNKNLGNAALNGGKTQQALQALGLSLRDLAGKDATEKLQVVAEKLRNVHDITLQTKLATDIFGKGGKDAVGLFNSNIDETIQKVRSLGITLTESQAKGLDKLSETKDLIGTIWEGFKDNVAAEVSPGFQAISDRIVEAIQGMGGLKNAAKSTADFIVSAMNSMVSAIKLAVESIRVVKGVADSLGISTILDKAKEGYKLLFADLKGIFNSQSAGVANLLKNTMSPNSKWRDNGPIFGSSVDNNTSKSTKEVSNSAFSKVSQEITASRVIEKYADTTEKAKKALEEHTKQLAKDKAAAEKLATFLDGFTQIKNAFDDPGKKQASSIINQGVEVNKVKLAPTEEFQALFDKALKRDSFGNFTNSQMYIEKLQTIINKGAGFDKDNKPIKSDTSGLVSALNELKAYLSGKNNKQQEVQVNIKVDSGPEFVTTITKDTTFKDAVDTRFKELTAAVARGSLQ